MTIPGLQKYNRIDIVSHNAYLSANESDRILKELRLYQLFIEESSACLHHLVSYMAGGIFICNYMIYNHVIRNDCHAKY